MRNARWFVRFKWWLYDEDLMFRWWFYDDSIMMLWWFYDETIMKTWKKYNGNLMFGGCPGGVWGCIGFVWGRFDVIPSSHWVNVGIILTLFWYHFGLILASLFASWLYKLKFTCDFVRIPDQGTRFLWLGTRLQDSRSGDCSPSRQAPSKHRKWNSQTLRTVRHFWRACGTLGTLETSVCDFCLSDLDHFFI